jgi:hypothetical protein
MRMPTFQLMDFDAACRLPEGLPSVGMEMNEQNVVEDFCAALLDGMRHFYFTFPERSLRKEKVDRLSIKLERILKGMRAHFLHYLRMGVYFTVVTPPELVDAAPRLINECRLAGYQVCCWMLDLSGGGDEERVSEEEVACWRSMSEACMAGTVGSLGMRGKSLNAFNKAVSDAGCEVRVAVLGMDIDTSMSDSEIQVTKKLGNKVNVVAMNPFGRGSQLLSRAPLLHVAEKWEVHPAMLLSAWILQVADGVMLPMYMDMHRDHEPDAFLYENVKLVHREMVKEFKKVTQDMIGRLHEEMSAYTSRGASSLPPAAAERPRRKSLALLEGTKSEGFVRRFRNRCSFSNPSTSMKEFLASEVLDPVDDDALESSLPRQARSELLQVVYVERDDQEDRAQTFPLGHRQSIAKMRLERRVTVAGIFDLDGRTALSPKVAGG